MDDRQGMLCHFVQASGRYLFASLGVPEDGLKHLPHTSDYVLYVFDTLAKAQAAANDACRLMAPVLWQVDQRIRPNCELELGTGQSPNPGPSHPWKITVHSDNGFVHDPLRVFEDVVHIVESGDWWSTPRVRTEAGTADGDEYELDRAYTPPRFKVPVPGHKRNFLKNPWVWGFDEDRNRVQGWTWVTGHKRYKDNPDMPQRMDRDVALGAFD